MMIRRERLWFSYAIMAYFTTMASGETAAVGETPATASGPFPSFALVNASAKADFTRLPRFYSDDPEYDAFVNEYFIRYLSVDERGVYWLRHPEPGMIDQLWCLEGDSWFLPWIDRGAMGLARQRGYKGDIVHDTLVRIPVDKYGYAWGSVFVPENPGVMGGSRVLYGWPWPKYDRNRTVDRPTGWEFNDAKDGAREQWTAVDVDLKPGYVKHHLVGMISGPSPEILSPAMDVDVFQVPILELDLAYRDFSNRQPEDLVKGLRIYWTTDDAPEFSEERMVTAAFSVLPPDTFAEYYENAQGASGEKYPPLVSGTSARYPLYFPMHLHPKWGRQGRHITRLKISPAGADAAGVSVALNYVRATYDVRLSTSNSVLIEAAAAFFLWSGDETFLRAVMPKLRRAMLFVNEHLRGKHESVLNFDWMVGHDGLGGSSVGHGLIGSYWDLLPAGRYDLESSLCYYAALRAMAALEEAARARGVAIPPVSVTGPDNETPLTYKESPKSLRSMAIKTKQAIERTFWNENTGRFCRNVDIKGNKHDYGFLHCNVQALAHGIGTAQQRDSVLSWLDGRVIEGDTSTGSDIYRWRFAPRTTTRHNKSYYFWPWVEGMDHPLHPFGKQVQNGGAVPFTSLFELVARTQTGRQDQIDRAYRCTLEVRDWFADVKAAGGQGPEFYRAYYNDHPERGLQQGGSRPGALGLDREFMSDAGMGTTFVLYAFLGVRTEKDRMLSVAPALPTAVSRMGVENVYYHGNHLTIEAGPRHVSFERSRLAKADDLKVRVTFRNAPRQYKVLVNEQPTDYVQTSPDGSITVVSKLRAVRIELRDNTRR